MNRVWADEKTVIDIYYHGKAIDRVIRHDGSMPVLPGYDDNTDQARLLDLAKRSEAEVDALVAGIRQPYSAGVPSLSAEQVRQVYSYLDAESAFFDRVPA